MPPLCQALLALKHFYRYKSMCSSQPLPDIEIINASSEETEARGLKYLVTQLVRGASEIQTQAGCPRDHLMTI